MVCISIHAIVWRVNGCKQEDQSVETALRMRATKVRVAAIMPSHPLWEMSSGERANPNNSLARGLIKQLHRAASSSHVRESSSPIAIEFIPTVSYCHAATLF